MGELTTRLAAARGGDVQAIGDLFALLYPELRKLAHGRLRQHDQLTLLDTTSLVHEAYLRFLRTGRVNAGDRPHFLAYCSRVMRSIIVDFARQRLAERRWGGQVGLSLEAAENQAEDGREEEILRVNAALTKLETADERLAQVVEMRYFTGMNFEDIAAALGVTERTARRDWQKARLLLIEILK